MAKKRKMESYDRAALRDMSYEFHRIRKPVSVDEVPKLQIDLAALEKTVKGLPIKEREKLEKFWGLIPGTVQRYKYSTQKIWADTSLRNMHIESQLILNKMISIEYLYLFDRNVSKLVKDINSKIDRTGVEEISDIDAIRYILMLFVFFVGGSKMPYDGDTIEADEESESKQRHDKYAFLNAIWNSTGHQLPEHSINLRLFIKILEMFDFKDVLAMKKFVGLPIPKEYDDSEIEYIETFWQIRKFKERIFKQGGWEAAIVLIYRPNFLENNMQEFSEKLWELSEDWESVSKYEFCKESIQTTDGERMITLYKIAGLEFSDTYELESLYVCRNYF